MSSSSQGQVVNQPAAKEPPIIKESSLDTGSAPTTPDVDPLYELLVCVMLYNHSRCKSRWEYPLADNDQHHQLMLSAAAELGTRVGHEEAAKTGTQAARVVREMPHSNVANWLNGRAQTQFMQASLVCQTYPELTPNWNAIDPLIPQKRQETKLRYGADWKYHHNSCAIDVLLALSVQLDAYRICHDQCRISKPQNTAELWLRRIALIPWGTITSVERTEIREKLRYCIARHSSQYRGPFVPRTVQDTFPILFAQMPQVSSLTVRRSWCCEKSDATYSRFGDTCLWNQALQATVLGNPDVTIIVKSDSEGETEKRTEPKKRPKATTSAGPQQAAKYNIADALRNVFRLSTDRRKTVESCSKEPCCTALSTEVIVLGRLSPTLVIDLSGLPGEWDLSDPGPIDVEYNYMDPRDCNASITSRAAHYSLQAVVYNEPAEEGYQGHFSMESKIKQDIFKKKMHHDTMGDGVTKSKCTPKNWTVKGRRPTLLVFRLCGELGG